MDLTPLRNKLLAERDLDTNFLPPETVERVVTSQMEQAGVSSVEELVSRIGQSSSRMRYLVEGLVTPPEGFFADPDLTSLLRDQIIPDIIAAAKASGEIRIWVTNCRQGYLAYDVAMLVSEALGKARGETSIRLYATDSDEEMVRIARSQDYPAEHFGELRRRGVTIGSKTGRPVLPDPVRSMIVFGKHDPIAQAPYAKQDLILCRGYLPLLTAEVRQRVLTKLTHGLAVDRALISGRGEVLGFDADKPTPSQPFSVFLRHVPHPSDLPPTRQAPGAPPWQVAEFAERLHIPVLLVDAQGFVTAANRTARELVAAEGLEPRRLSEAGSASPFFQIISEARAVARAGEARAVHCRRGWRAGIAATEGHPDTPPSAVVVMMGCGDVDVEETESAEAALNQAVLQVADVVARNWEHDLQTDRLRSQSTLMTQSLYKQTEELNRARDRLETVNIELRIANRELERALDERERARAQLEAAYEREHHIADTLQSSLLTPFPEHIGGYSIAGRYLAAFEEAEVGGDFYHVHQMPGNRVVIALGDVSGKGLEAAVYAYMVKNMMLGFASEDPSPASLLTRLNGALLDYSEVGWFITMVYMLLDTAAGKLHFGSAGHEPVALYRPATDMAELLFPTGKAVGLAADGDYRQTTLNIEPNDALLVYTDGISDAGSWQNPLAPEGVLDILREQAALAPAEILEKLYEAAFERAGGRLRDDAASLCIKREG